MLRRSFSIIRFLNAKYITLIHASQTIIEAIRYAITGTVPPGTHGGKLFINDPKMSGSADVSVEIKIPFKYVHYYFDECKYIIAKCCRY